MIPLNQIEALPQEHRSDALKQHIKSQFFNPRVIEQVLEIMVTPSIISPPETSHLLDFLYENIVTQPEEIQETLLEVILPILHREPHSFANQIWTFSLQYSVLLQQLDDLEKSAQVLQRVPYKLSTFSQDKAKLFQLFLRTSRLLIELENNADAISYVNRAQQLVEYADKNSLVALKVCQARIQDFNKNFQAAASKYYQLSLILNNPEDQKDSMIHSIVNSILGPPSTQRTRHLDLLYKDSRIQKLELFPILTRVAKLEILTKPDVNCLEKFLYSHQKAVLSNGLTVLENSIIQHNIVAVSNVYSSIRIYRLAEILLISEEKTLSIVTQMMIDDRLHGMIDEPKGLIFFTPTAESQVKVTGAGQESSNSYNLEHLNLVAEDRVSSSSEIQPTPFQQNILSFDQEIQALLNSLFSFVSDMTS